MNALCLHLAANAIVVVAGVVREIEYAEAVHRLKVWDLRAERLLGKNDPAFHPRNAVCEDVLGHWAVEPQLLGDATAAHDQALLGEELEHVSRVACRPARFTGEEGVNSIQKPNGVHRNHAGVHPLRIQQPHEDVRLIAGIGQHGQRQRPLGIQEVQERLRVERFCRRAGPDACDLHRRADEGIKEDDAPPKWALRAVESVLGEIQVFDSLPTHGRPLQPQIELLPPRLEELAILYEPHNRSLLDHNRLRNLFQVGVCLPAAAACPAGDGGGISVNAPFPPIRSVASVIACRTTARQ